MTLRICIQLQTIDKLISDKT